MKIIFRADGNSKIGHGHMTRTLAFAQALKGHFPMKFISQKPNDTFQKLIYNSVEEPIFINETEDYRYEGQHILKYITSKDILVLDGYNFDTSYVQTLKSTGCAVVKISDYPEDCSFVDVLVNHAPGFTADQYKLSLCTKYYSGTDYALLRSEFFKRKKPKDKEERIFICFGGADNDDITSKTVDAVLSSIPNKIIEVVIGGSNKLESHNWPHNVTLHHNLSASQMADLMEISSLAICPASSISYEAASIGTFIIAGKTAENQKGIYDFLTQNNLASGVGDFRNLSVHDLSILIKNYWNSNTEEEQKKAQSIFFDGKSGERLKKIIEKLSQLGQLTIRKANIGDVDILFEWLNDPLARSTALNPAQVEFEDHLRWFSSVLKDKNRYLYLIEQNSKSIGQLRFDVASSIVTLSYSLDNQFRGRGLGECVVRKGICQLVSDLGYEPEIHAVVWDNNVPSIKVFESNHFTLIESKNINGRIFNVYSRKGC